MVVGPDGVRTGSALLAADSADRAAELELSQESADLAGDLERRRASFEAKMAAMRAEFEVDEAQAKRLLDTSEEAAAAAQANRREQERRRSSKPEAHGAMSTPAEPPDSEGTPTPDRLHLTLFISGASPASAWAVRRLCDRHARGGYDLRIVDIYKEPEEVYSRGLLAVPTLIKELPLPVNVLIGDFTNEPQVLAALGLPTPRDD